MPWRCPHCGVPQPESSRCWVCHRSTTSCGTCRNFRQSVSPRLGYCGLDRSRALLHGDEIRPCWESRADVPASERVLPPSTRDRPTTPAAATRSLWADLDV